MARLVLHASSHWCWCSARCAGAVVASSNAELVKANVNAYVDGLSGRYRLIVTAYPPIGEQARAEENSFTPDRVCADILAVADAARADRFAWYGYSWGGVVGLQLAARTQRLSALICGGWPPLGAPYKEMTTIVEADRSGRPKNYATYYRSLVRWPERESVAKFTCPRMTFAGANDVIFADGLTVRIGPAIAEHQEELERMGWTVRLFEGFQHELGDDPAQMIPLIRGFLDPIRLRA